MIRVEHVLDSWKAIRADTAQAVEDMPADELSFKPVLEVGSFGEIARHALDSGHALSGLLLAGVEDMTVNFREEVGKHVHPLSRDAGQTELAAALRSSADERAAELLPQTPEWWAHVIVRFDGQKVTRLEMMQMVKEHELTHRSQLFMYLRLKGLVPSTTRRRLAKQQARDGR
ncbi:MAG TPA: DinB family protein [Bryobacteraceae bacterium]|nr:DinB family protein [Bryobacteraceae bacterium]